MPLFALTGRLWQAFRADARHAQILFLGSFLLYGCLALGWQAEGTRYAMTLAGALSAQMLAIGLRGLPLSGLKSALITGLGLCLLLKSGQPWVGGLAGALAVGSKFLFRWQGKHLFNPANLGVVATAWAGLSWVSPGQWGSGPLLLFLIGGAGLLVLTAATRLDTAFAFLAAFGGAQALWQVAWLGWPWDHWLHSLSSGSLLLFAFFMITDPMTTPGARLPRMAWAAGIALLSVFLQVRFALQTAPLFVLGFASLLVPLLDHRWPAARFAWNPSLRHLQPAR